MCSAGGNFTSKSPSEGVYVQTACDQNTVKLVIMAGTFIYLDESAHQAFINMQHKHNTAKDTTTTTTSTATIITAVTNHNNIDLS